MPRHWRRRRWLDRLDWWVDELTARWLCLFLLGSVVVLECCLGSLCLWVCDGVCVLGSHVQLVHVTDQRRYLLFLRSEFQFQIFI